MSILISVLIYVFSVVCALAVAVLAFVFIIPANRRERLNKFGQFIHDLLNFKYLVLEKILRFMYVFSTAFALINGFFSLFSFENVPVQTAWGYGSVPVWTGWRGLIYMIVGPIVIRIVYEFIMMVFIASKNIIEINSKLKKQNSDAVTDEKTNIINNSQTTTTAKFCSMCGHRLGENGECVNPECNSK